MSFVKHSLTTALLFTTATCLAAFDTANAPANDTLTPGLNAYLAQRGKLCLGKTQWPIDVTPAEMAGGDRNANQMPALERLGLVRSSDARVKQTMDGKTQTMKVKRYVLTAEGEKYYQMSTPAPSSYGSHEPVRDFCAGTLSLDRIVKWSEPVQVKGVTQTVVTYTYKIDAPPWAKTDISRHTFPVVARMVNGAGKLELEETFSLTPKGWQAVDIAE